MSSAQAIDQGTPSSPEASALRSPLALSILALAFAVACTGAYGLAARRNNAGAGQFGSRRFSTGALALLQARLEQQALMASVLNSGNAELKHLDEEVAALRQQLDKTTGLVTTKKQEFDTLTKQTTDDESLRKALVAELSRLKSIQKAFDDTLAIKKQADTAIQAAMGSQPAMLTDADLKGWQKSWDDVSKGALDAIEKARNSLTGLQSKQDQWIKGKDTFTQDEQKQRQVELRTLHTETAANLKAAREAAGPAEKKLNDLIQAQRQQLDKALSAAPPP